MKKQFRRRDFLIGGLAAGVGLSAPYLQPARAQFKVDPKQMTKTLRFSSYGGQSEEALTKAAIEPFQAKYDVRVVRETHGNEEPLIAKMKASGPDAYDI